MQVSFGSVSHPGKVREENQDRLGWIVHEEAADALFIVADGMGGHRGGAEASRLAIEAALNHFKTQLAGDITTRLAGAVEAANRAVEQAAARDPMLTGMGTTFSALHLDGLAATIAHVGDSRVYRIDSRGAQLITTDHLRSSELAAALNISIEEAWKYAPKNALSRAVGVRGTVDAEITVHSVEVGQIWVLCSDGLQSLTTHDLEQAATTVATQEMADKLVQLAIHRDGSDNTSAIVVRVQQL